MWKAWTTREGIAGFFAPASLIEPRVDGLADARRLGEGGEWDKAYSYFSNAWRWVLGMLEYRFNNGPVDWKDPPEIRLDK